MRSRRDLEYWQEKWELGMPEWGNLTDRERELAYLAVTMRPGMRVRYSSVGEPGYRLGLGDRGTVLDYACASGLAKVIFEGQAEPEWIAAGLLHIDG